MTKTTRKAGGRHKPITAHRLFPAFAALWFAALLGLASFVVPANMLQRVVVATGLPHLVAAAAPPLGFTARALVALLLTGLGGLLGLVIGLRLGARHRPAMDPADNDFDIAAPAAVAAMAPRVRARDAHPDAPPRPPLAVSADMIDDAETAIVADDAVAPPRRRALVSPDSSGADRAIDPVDDLLSGGPGFARDAFDPFAIYESEGESAEPFVPPAFLAQALGAVTGERNVPAPDAASVVDAALQPIPAASAGAEVVPPAPAPASDEDIATLLHEAALPPDEAFIANAVPVPEETGQPAASGAQRAPSLFAMARQAVGETGGSPVAQADLDGLGLVQLVERLALAIADHRRALDSAMEETAPVHSGAPFAPVAAPVAADTGDRVGGDAGQAGRSPVAGDVLAMPRLHRIGPSDHAATDGPAGEAMVLEQRYTSHTGMAGTVRQADSAHHALSASPAAAPQPVVIFPSQPRAIRRDEGDALVAPPAPFEKPHLATVPRRFQSFAGSDAVSSPDAQGTEQALRDALATLQRMTANR